MHEHIQDQLSDYIDDELPSSDRAAVEAHVADCPECARVLAELQEIVATASSLRPTRPHGDLWTGIAERIEMSGPAISTRAPRRFSFTLPQLAAASVLLAMVSGGSVALLLDGRTQGAESRDAGLQVRQPELAAPTLDPTDLDVVSAVSYADAQFDAAMADLERALENGRGRLDAETVAVVEENLSIIDRAITEARDALASDPSNGYLSGHLMEARRRKLDLLRRATALTDVELNGT